MWNTLALVASLSLTPAQADGLKLANDRTTFGLLGAPRGGNKILPGDVYWVAFDIENVTVSNAGRVRYTMGMEVVDSAGKVMYAERPTELDAVNSLGGRRLPAFAKVEVGTEMAPGPYTLRVQVGDLVGKGKQTLVNRFEVLPKNFGLVRFHLTSDDRGTIPAPALGYVGQTVVVNFAVVGFERDRAKKNPHVSVEMSVIDEDGKATLAQPFAGSAKDSVPEAYSAIPMQFLLNLNRPGKFTVKLKATDNISKKNSELSIPLTVADLSAK